MEKNVLSVRSMLDVTYYSKETPPLARWAARPVVCQLEIIKH